ncbi:hypothetical protein L2E82_46189 [Cichorium intybus]|uniref:Uncharacterized protein n=1 Tax=Cichorium intybus TaxID=13427 RepID=A0ACB8YTH3_CICIN|nr:hypothetical protein L2E82_46189 [Cichorium intybus]
MEWMPLMKSAVYESLRIKPPMALQYGKAKCDVVYRMGDGGVRRWGTSSVQEKIFFHYVSQNREARLGPIRTHIGALIKRFFSYYVNATFVPVTVRTNIEEPKTLSTEHVNVLLDYIHQPTPLKSLFIHYNQHTDQRSRV